VGGWGNQAISSALDVSVATIERVRQQLVEEGFEAVLSYKQRKRNKPRSLDGEKEAHLMASA
jgi:transposase